MRPAVCWYWKMIVDELASPNLSRLYMASTVKVQRGESREQCEPGQLRPK